MKKEQEKKIMISLYIIIALLVLNTICHFITISKLSNKPTENVSDNKTGSSNSTYDVSSMDQLTPSEITKKIKNGDEIVLYIGQEKCTYCQKMLPTLKEAQTNYGYKTVYLNIAATNVNSTEYKEMSALLDVEKTSNGETKQFGEFRVTPMIAIIRNGKMVDGMIGYNTYDNFAKFLEAAGIKKK